MITDSEEHKKLFSPSLSITSETWDLTGFVNKLKRPKKKWRYGDSEMPTLARFG